MGRDSFNSDGLPLLACPPAQAFGGPGADYGYALAVDQQGNSYLAGSFRQTVDFGTGPLTAQGESDLFIASYRPDGQARWARSFGGASSLDPPSNHRAQSVALDSQGNVYFTGGFDRNVDFDGEVLTAPSKGVFLASFSADGSLRWAKGFSDPYDDQGRAVAVDAQDNIYLAGVQQGSPDFGGGSREAFGLQDIFVASYEAEEGLHRWSKTFGSAEGHEGAYGLAVDARGLLHLTGEFRGTVNFGDQPLASAGYSENKRRGGDSTKATFSGQGRRSKQ